MIGKSYRLFIIVIVPRHLHFKGACQTDSVVGHDALYVGGPIARLQSVAEAQRGRAGQSLTAPGVADHVLVAVARRRDQQRGPLRGALGRRGGRRPRGRGRRR